MSPPRIKKRKPQPTPEEIAQQALVGIAKAGKKAVLKAIDSLFADAQRGAAEATRRLGTARKRIDTYVHDDERQVVEDDEEE